MSSFKCSKCNASIIDSPGGPYITGCEHYPLETMQTSAQESKPMPDCLCNCKPTDLKKDCLCFPVWCDICRGKRGTRKRMCLCGNEVTPELQAKIDEEFKNMPVKGLSDNKSSTGELIHPMCRCVLPLNGERVHGANCPIWPNNKDLELIPPTPLMQSHKPSTGEGWKRSSNKS